MKATFLVDNIGGCGLEGEWGLSVFIEYMDKKILLDAGASNLFLENAKSLGVDLEAVDYAVLSHAHYDHANGMEGFFEINRKAKFYIQKSVEENVYAKKWIFKKYIGIPKGILEQRKDRIEKVSGNFKLCDGVYIIPHSTDGLEEVGKREKMYIKTKYGLKPDCFAHEQSLVFDTEKGLVIFNSCSHGGAANIINEVSSAFPGKKVYAMLGGFHLHNKSEKYIVDFASKVKETGVEYVCTGHCTGDASYEVLKRELGDICNKISVGLVVEF